MDNKKQANQGDRLSTALKWGLGAVIVWNLLPPEAKDNMRRWLSQLGEGLAASQQQQAEQERKRQFLESLSTALKQVGNRAIVKTGISTLPVCKPQASTEVDSRWREVVVHPSVVLVLGKRGSGKSALGYRLLELNRYGLIPYMLGIPKQGQKLLPEWIGITQDLEDIPQKAIVLVDEAYLRYHSRDSLAVKSKEMSQILNLSRQREQTLIFVSQEARQVDKNIASSANVVIFKDLGILQLEFERPELNKIAAQAKQAFAGIDGNKRDWSYVYAPDSDFMGLVENSLPSFWSEKLSHIFATGGEIRTRPPNKTPLEQRIEKAKQLKQQRLSLGQIAKFMGVSKGTIKNWLDDYPYKR